MKKFLHSILAAAMLGALVPAAQASSNPFVGEIDWFAGNFAPSGWALCDGQLLPVSGNEVLASLLGTTYGGDGINDFALPDVRGRVLIHAGTGIGLSPRAVGDTGGNETETLTEDQMPEHNHRLRASGGNADESSPGGNVLAATGRTRIYDDSGAADVSMAITSISNKGGGQPHNNMQPFNTLNCIIALEGIDPTPISE